MRALVLKELNGPLFLEEVPIPKPLAGQVLVKMEASPIHPADFSFMRGQYGITKPLPVIPGNEGCGVVIENGGGLYGWKIKGEKVAVASTVNSTGTWAEYMVADAIRCIPLSKDTTFEEGAFALGNPITALGFYDVAMNEKARAVILSAGCSAVSRMSARYFQSKGIPVINIVRRKEQDDVLKGDGEKFVLNSTEENFEANLKEVIDLVKPTVFFDSVGGTLTGIVLKAMPNKSVVYMYGFLSKDKCEIDGRDLRYKEKSLKGFFLSSWIKEKGNVKMLLVLNEMRNSLKTILKTNISKVICMEEIDEGIKFYKKNMSEGKILISFSKKKGVEIEEKKELEKENINKQIAKEESVEKEELPNKQIDIEESVEKKELSSIEESKKEKENEKN